jgi:hypothetical protein
MANIVVPWFQNAADYDAIKAVLIDGADLPDTFEAWSDREKGRAAKLAEKEFSVQKINVNLAEFSDWSHTSDLDRNTYTLNAFAVAKANGP